MLMIFSDVERSIIAAPTGPSCSRGVDGCGCSEVCFPDVCCAAHRVSLVVPHRKAHVGLSRTCLFHPT